MRCRQLRIRLSFAVERLGGPAGDQAGDTADFSPRNLRVEAGVPFEFINNRF